MNEFFDIVRPLVEFQFNSILSRCLTCLPFRANFLNPHNKQAAQTKQSEDNRMTNIFEDVIP